MRDMMFTIGGMLVMAVIFTAESLISGFVCWGLIIAMAIYSQLRPRHGS